MTRRLSRPSNESAVYAERPFTRVCSAQDAILDIAQLRPGVELLAGREVFPRADLRVGIEVANLRNIEHLRSGVVSAPSGAMWREIDFEAREWRIPAERMKTKREHRIPLSTGALAVLRQARELADGSGLVFPSPRGRALSEVAMPTMVRNLGIEAVPHGFRSSFRDWAAECSDAPREVCELALAHVNTNAIEAAYRRTDLFERRRDLMEQWAAFLAGGGAARGANGGAALPS